MKNAEDVCKINLKIYKEILIYVRDKFIEYNELNNPYGFQFICYNIYKVTVNHPKINIKDGIPYCENPYVQLFSRGRCIVPDEFKGDFWIGLRAWWSISVGDRSILLKDKIFEIHKLKIGYLTYLIENL